MTLFYIFAVVFVAYLVQAITGFGGALLSLPILILLVGFDPARILTTSLSLVTGLLVAIRYRKHINRKKLMEILAFMAVGTGAGLVLDRFLEAEFLIIIYGVVTILLALFRFLPKRNPGRSPGRPLMILILLLAGLMQGLFVAGGAFLMVYAMYEFPDKQEFRSTSSAVWGILNWFMLFYYLLSDKITSENLKLMALCIPIVLLMAFLAEKLQGKINQALFSKLTNALLLVTGVILLASR